MIVFDLQRIRIEKNLTQKKVAELTGFPQSFISVIERGKASAPEGFINKVAELFDIDNIEDYTKEVANIVVREQKKRAQANKGGNDVSGMSSFVDPVVAPVQVGASIEQTNVAKLIDLLEKKERKIEKLERENERLREQLLALLTEGKAK